MEEDTLKQYSAPKLLFTACGKVQGYRREKFAELSSDEKDKLKEAILSIQSALIDCSDVIKAHKPKNDSF